MKTTQCQHNVLIFLCGVVVCAAAPLTRNGKTSSLSPAALRKAKLPRVLRGLQHAAPSPTSEVFPIKENTGPLMTVPGEAEAVAGQPITATTRSDPHKSPMSSEQFMARQQATSSHWPPQSSLLEQAKAARAQMRLPADLLRFKHVQPTDSPHAQPVGQQKVASPQSPAMQRAMQRPGNVPHSEHGKDPQLASQQRGGASQSQKPARPELPANLPRFESVLAASRAGQQLAMTQRAQQLHSEIEKHQQQQGAKAGAEAGAGAAPSTGYFPYGGRGYHYVPSQYRHPPPPPMAVPPPPPPMMFRSNPGNTFSAYHNTFPASATQPIQPEAEAARFSSSRARKPTLRYIQ